ncbi:aldolase/citrate lyase family protein [Paracoccus sp. (in: a-proteobacteria)]|uniref:aldolase/citrate lyase family protein n=1 Tax=Paracoccus sp. TaxID=267 RepID=UPI0026E07371|nr:aldolase/citrate lyase family protein [Paracoccus sp. (in: a-proteobacteria)]MDO5371770.1 aldolase/citrate lyase family protein [Paracoccus sp. (in: a-proteobacteria)]
MYSLRHSFEDRTALPNRDAAGAYTALFIAARTACLYAAAASGAVAIDAVYVDFRDDAGLRAEAAEAVRDGFTSKAAIHPAQVAVINEIFTPDADTVAEAEAIVSALSGGKSVAVLNGRLVEAPHLKKAQKILARAMRRTAQGGTVR